MSVQNNLTNCKREVIIEREIIININNKMKLHQS